jgi:phage recombination protein Bet
MSTKTISLKESDALQAPQLTALSSETLELIKSTVAKGATNEELRLFLFDCQRQGVHPLDRLIYCRISVNRNTGERTYTAITSIDFMRMRAADTGEHAGTDDATFDFKGDETIPYSATVRVYRLDKLGVPRPYTATARWAEYLPPKGQDWMWLKMPHGQLAKCAEALALRKAFPKQLHGLYERAEMAQAGREDGSAGEGNDGRSREPLPVDRAAGGPGPVSNVLPESPSDRIPPTEDESRAEAEELFPDPEKEKLISECGAIIKNALAAKTITQKDVRAMKKTYLSDENADPNKCDIAALSDLRAYLKTRFEREN